MNTDKRRSKPKTEPSYRQTQARLGIADLFLKSAALRFSGWLGFRLRALIEPFQAISGAVDSMQGFGFNLFEGFGGEHGVIQVFRGKGGQKPNRSRRSITQ